MKRLKHSSSWPSHIPLLLGGEGVNHATVVSLPFERDLTGAPVAPAGGRHHENAAVRRSQSATTAELLLAEVLFQFLLGLSRAMVAA